MIKRITLLTLVSGMLLSNTISAAALSDFTNSALQFGSVTPGIACKTRTNNEATVRNLAHGVWNRDSNTRVALNCGVSAPYPMVLNSANFNNSRIDGNLIVSFGRSANTSLAQANTSTCAISVSSVLDSAQTPNSNGVLLGSLSPGFSGAVGQGEQSSVSVATDNVPYPGGVINMFTAFCQLARGVRIQAVTVTGGIIRNFAVTP